MPIPEFEAEEQRLAFINSPAEVQWWIDHDFTLNEAILAMKIMWGLSQDEFFMHDSTHILLALALFLNLSEEELETNRNLGFQGTYEAEIFNYPLDRILDEQYYTGDGERNWYFSDYERYRDDVVKFSGQWMDKENLARVLLYLLSKNLGTSTDQVNSMANYSYYSLVKLAEQHGIKVDTKSGKPKVTDNGKEIDINDLIVTGKIFEFKTPSEASIKRIYNRIIPGFWVLEENIMLAKTAHRMGVKGLSFNSECEQTNPEMQGIKIRDLLTAMQRHPSSPAFVSAPRGPEADELT